MTAEYLRHVRGGVIGGFTPVQVRVVVPEEGIEAGELPLGVKVPAGHFVYGVSIRNTEDDLVGDGATLGVKVGIMAELQDLEVGNVKGVGIAKIVEEPLYLEEDAELILDIATAPLTKGTLDVGIIYG